MVWGDKIDQFDIQAGEAVDVSIDLESREYNGRWYTDVKAWKVSRQSSEGESKQSFDKLDRDAPPIPNAMAFDDGDIPF